MIWISTHRQLADDKSREILWNEEFIPMPLFDKICQDWQIRPLVDVMATKANRKCPFFINLGRDSDDACLGFDFFSYPPSKLKDSMFYIFPPKNLLDQTAYHLEKYYLSHSFLMIYHSFGTIPASVTALIKASSKHQRLVDQCSIIPEEKELFAYGRKYWGVWNNRKTATFALLMNP